MAIFPESLDPPRDYGKNLINPLPWIFSPCVFHFVFSQAELKAYNFEIEAFCQIIIVLKYGAGVMAIDQVENCHQQMMNSKF